MIRLPLACLVVVASVAGCGGEMPAADLAPPPDLALPADDLASTPDLAVVPDLTPLPDLTEPPDLVPLPSCTDKVKNGDESDVDCGGSCMTRCETGKGCAMPPDCASSVCMNGSCQDPTCMDGVKNGKEPDVDCGGPCMKKCADGSGCALAPDCTSGVCAMSQCAAPTCMDGAHNGDETDTDCGGSCMQKCAAGFSCKSGLDCADGVCSATLCAVPSCGDKVRNQNETDVDCGGRCQPCASGKGCKDAVDCLTKSCQNGLCADVQCTDKIKNGSETDVDCGGTCPACQAMQACKVNADCASRVCSIQQKLCVAGACNDQVKNGDETDVDCGGSCMQKCAAGKACTKDGDCVFNDCANRVCSNVCNNGQRDSGETDVDCGGPVCGKCDGGNLCLAAADCLSRSCLDGVCADTSLLVAYRFEEGMGNVVADSSGNGLRGTFTTPVWSQSGFSGKAGQLNGTNAVISVPNNALFNALPSITVSARVFVNRYNNTPMFVSKVGAFNLGVLSNGTLRGDYPPPTLTGGALPLGRWVHVAMAYDGKSSRLYLDGQAVAAAARVGVIATANTPLELGRQGATYYLDGQLDDVRVYRGARSSVDLLNDATFLAWYRFDEASGDAVIDATGNGFTGQLVKAGRAPGKAFSAAALDGTQGYVALPASGATSVGDFTISLWFNLTDGSPSRSVLLDLRGDGAEGTAAPALVINTLQNGAEVRSFVEWSKGVTTEFQAPIPAPAGGWHHLALVRAGAVLTSYYDGKPLPTAFLPGGAAPRADRLSFGLKKRLGTAAAAMAGAPEFFAGQIDQARIYSRALPAVEIAAQFANP